MLIDLSQRGRQLPARRLRRPSSIGGCCSALWRKLMFTMRFVVQWIASERAGKSVIPIAFWFFSIGGGLLLFGYALYIRDPVFILGQGFGVFVYVRNLYFELRDRRRRAAAV